MCLDCLRKSAQLDQYEAMILDLRGQLLDYEATLQDTIDDLQEARTAAREEGSHLR